MNPVTDSILPEIEKATRKSVKWYDLERITPYRDLFLVVGFGCVVYGISRIYVPGAWIVAGAGLIYGSLRMG